MKSLFAYAAAIGLLASCNTTTSTSTKTEQEASSAEHTAAVEEEWISLFDGESTAGWHTYGKNTVGEAWQAADGVLYLDASRDEGWQSENGGDIVTDQEFEDFHLKLEWKIAENANSGIMFYVHEDTSKYEYPWYTGPEMQILHNEGHPDGKIYKHQAGDLYDLQAATVNATKPVGEWNQAEIISQNGQLEFILNDTRVVTTSLWDESWKQLIAESKFSEMPDFGTYKKGRIALQDHGDPVWFRNIMIKRL